MGLEVHLTCSRACMLIVGAAFKESMVGKQYDQADEQERASVRPFAEYALSSADSTRRGVVRAESSYDGTSSRASTGQRVIICVARMAQRVSSKLWRGEKVEEFLAVAMPPRCVAF